MFDWIVSDTLQYLGPPDCMQMNEKCWIELLVLNNSVQYNR